MGDRPVDTKSSRSVVRSCGGMVATSQPLAVSAGVEVLLKGGNAVEAVIAASAVLGVTEPCMTGLGGDAFALIWDAKAKKLRGINGSGRSSKASSAESLLAKGMREMPAHGPDTVTVPGLVSVWDALHREYGTMPLAELLSPAIRHAQEGYPVSEIVAAQWRRAESFLRADEHAHRLYLPKDRAPRAGEVFRNRDLAESLKQIASLGPRAFYEGNLAARMCAAVQKAGGCLELSDFQSHRVDWCEPISTNYKGYDVYELPPNGQGAVVLEMLNILEAYDLKQLGHNSAAYLHLLIEAKKLAFAYRKKYIADPDFQELPVDRLISKAYAAAQRAKIDPQRASFPEESGLRSSDTSYLTIVDKDRNCVSFICSIFDDFGSGIVPEGTGFVLQNRGSLFSLESGHFNRLEPGKRPLHTIIPAMVLKEGTPWLCYGVMGGNMQPQGHVQVLLNLLEFGMDVQEAGEAPRVCAAEEGVYLESGIPWNVRIALMEKGHTVLSGLDIFGGYQGILIDSETGALAGGSDIRKDGCAMGI